MYIPDLHATLMSAFNMQGNVTITNTLRGLNILKTAVDCEAIQQLGIIALVPRSDAFGILNNNDVTGTTAL